MALSFGLGLPPALSKGGGVSPFAFTYNGEPFTFAGIQFTYGAQA